MYHDVMDWRALNYTLPVDFTKEEFIVINFLELKMECRVSTKNQDENRNVYLYSIYF